MSKAKLHTAVAIITANSTVHPQTLPSNPGILPNYLLFTQFLGKGKRELKKRGVEKKLRKLLY